MRRYASAANGPLRLGGSRAATATTQAAGGFEGGARGDAGDGLGAEEGPVLSGTCATRAEMVPAAAWIVVVPATSLTPRTCGREQTSSVAARNERSGWVDPRARDVLA